MKLFANYVQRMSKSIIKVSAQNAQTPIVNALEKTSPNVMDAYKINYTLSVHIRLVLMLVLMVRLTTLSLINVKDVVTIVKLVIQMENALHVQQVSNSQIQVIVFQSYVPLTIT